MTSDSNLAYFNYNFILPHLSHCLIVESTFKLFCLLLATGLLPMANLGEHLSKGAPDS